MTAHPTTATQSLAEFLTARLEDEQAEAEGALRHPRPLIGRGPWWEFYATHDPARVLAGVAAKRAVLALHKPLPAGLAPRHVSETLCRCCNDYAPCPTLRHLAAVYSDHAQYRSEWAP